MNCICPTCGSEERYKDGRCAPCTRTSNQRWKENNRGRHRAGSLKWQSENTEARRITARNWGRRNRTKVSANKRSWRQRNPDKHVAQEHARRAQKVSSGGTYTTTEWVQLCEKYEKRCLCCNRSDVLLTVDHVIPLSRGGSNTIENIQPLCGQCNSTKGTQIIDYRIDWMRTTGSRDTEIAQAIPPAYTAWIAPFLLAAVQANQEVPV